MTGESPNTQDLLCQTLPKGLSEVTLPAGQAAELRAALRSHLTGLTQDWAEQVAAIIGRVTGPQT